MLNRNQPGRMTKGGSFGRRFRIAVALCLPLVDCSGHIAERIIAPGTAVNGRGGRPFAELPPAVQQTFPADQRECVRQNTVSVPDDALALQVLVQAAVGVLAARGGGRTAMVQGGFNNAAQALDTTPPSDRDQLLEVRTAAEIKVSDCLKSRGWDAVPRYTVGPPEPPI